MQHSQPHITLYQAVTLLSWGGNMLRKVESIMMMLSSASIASFSSPYSVGITILCYSSLTDTCNENFGTNCYPADLSIDNLRQSLAFGDYTTWG